MRGSASQMSNFETRSAGNDPGPGRTATAPRRRPLPMAFAVLAAGTWLGAGGLLLRKTVFVPPIGLGSLIAIVVLTTVGGLAFWTSRVLQRQPRHACLRPWLAAAMVLFTCAGIDLVCGLWKPSRHGPLMRADARHHHVLLPNQTATLDDTDLPYTMRTNARGLRGGEIGAKPAQTRRLLFLGDSFTMGKGVDEADTFVARVGERLNAASTGIRYEVVNAGIDSYAPLLSRLEFEDLLDLDFDHVVHCLDMSDLMQEQAYRRLAVRDEDGHIVGVPGRPRSLAEWAMQHTLITGMIVAALRDASEVTVGNFVRQPNRGLLQHTLADDEVDRAHQWDAIFASIGDIVAICRARDIAYTLAIYPWGHQVSEQEWSTGRRFFMEPDAEVSDDVRTTVAERAQRAGIALVDAFDAFRAYDADAPLYFDEDMHWTPAGHAVMADVLVQQLRL